MYRKFSKIDLLRSIYNKQKHNTQVNCDSKVYFSIIIFQFMSSFISSCGPVSIHLVRIHANNFIITGTMWL